MRCDALRLDDFFVETLLPLRLLDKIALLEILHNY